MKRLLSANSNDTFRRHLIALLLAGVMTAILLWPYRPSGMVKNGELYGYIGGVVDARNALAEGQFPIRVPPKAADGTRYPVYQFYANLPYTLAGGIHFLFTKNPYTAWKYAMASTLLVGGWSMYALLWQWTRRHGASLLASAIFLSAPYVHCDLHDRGAMAELTALCLYPAALLCTWQTARTTGVGWVAACALAWAGVALSHNITFLYGATFASPIAIVAILSSGVSSRWRAVGRLILAGGLMAMMVAWYLAPQVVLMPRLGIAGSTSTPWVYRDLTSLDVLLSPIVKTPATSTVPRLGLQVGWLIVLAVLAATATWAMHRRTHLKDAAASRLLTPTLALLWLLAFLVAWQPIDFWSAVPRQFHFVQFSYRLLGFTSLFGAMLGGLALAQWPQWRWIIAVAGVAVLLTCGICYPRYSVDDYHPDGNWRWIVNKPEMAGGNGMYQLSPGEQTARPAFATSRVPREQSQLKRRPGGGAVFDLDIPPLSSAWVTLPVLHYPQMLSVTVDGEHVNYGADDRWVVLAVPPGRHRIDVWFTGLRWANYLSLAGWVVCLLCIVLIAVRSGRNAITPVSERTHKDPEGHVIQ